jgi:hypothetical protein
MNSAFSTRVGPLSSIRHWLLVIVCLAVSGGASYFVLTTYVFARLPATIVGSWRVESGEMKGDTMTFHRDGTFTAMVRANDGSVAPVKARVELRDETLRYIFEMPGAGRQERTQTIKSLTPTEMIVQEGSGTCRLVRIE